MRPLSLWENGHNDPESCSKLSSIPQQWQIHDFPDEGASTPGLGESTIYLARFLPYYYFFKVHKYGASAGIFQTSLPRLPRFLVLPNMTSLGNEGFN